MRLFGEVDAVVRLPFLMHLSLFFAAVASLARERAGQALNGVNRTLVWARLDVYSW